jgi:nucleotide-binding universal stress UspA family protein
MDHRLISAVKYWSDIIKPASISFVYVRKEDEAWQGVDNTIFNQMLKNERENDKKWIDQIKSTVSSFSMATDVITTYGSSLEKIISLVVENNFDLVIAGKKQSTSSTGELTIDLAKRIPSSFMLVPETAVNKCENIIVPTDSSSYVNLAINIANQIKQNATKAEIIPANIYSVPTGYRYLGADYDEISLKMKTLAQEKVRKQFDKLNVPCKEAICRLSEQQSNAAHLQQIATDIQGDLIIVGSKGMSNSAHVLMGSTTAKMMRFMGRAPLLILKKKGETYDLLNAFLEILDPEKN